MLLHTNTIAQNRPARVRTGGVHRDDSNCVVLLAVVTRKLVHEGALARARGAGEPKYSRMSRIRK